MYWKIIRRVHGTWHFTAACFGVVLGAGLSYFLHVGAGLTGWVWPVLAVATLGFCIWRQRLFLTVLALMAGMMLGLWRGSVAQGTAVIYDQLYGKVVQLRGVVSDDTDTGKDGEIVVRLRDVSTGEVKLPGEVWVSLASHSAKLERSDIVAVKGKLQTGFGSFAASMYRAELLSAERPNPGDIALHIRDGFAGEVREVVRDPGASLGLGYLTGQKRSLPDDLQLALQIAGLTHIVVASGYNLSILIRITKRLFEKVSKYLVLFSSTSLVLVFITITGFSPSMVRAGLVTMLSLGMWYVGRRFHPVTLLGFAAAITALINPGYVWGNLGWQLSFAAFAGVMILAPLLQAYFYGDKKPGFFRQIIGETMSAQIMTAPIIILAFGQFSNIALVSNLLILPLVPLAMLLTFITGMVQMVVPALVPAFAWMTQTLLDYMVGVARWAAHVPWAQSKIEITGWMAAGMYVVIVAAIIYLWRASGYSLRSSNIVE